jgi:hypothetical protein
MSVPVYSLRKVPSYRFIMAARLRESDKSSLLDVNEILLQLRHATDKDNVYRK